MMNFDSPWWVTAGACFVLVLLILHRIERHNRRRRLERYSAALLRDDLIVSPDTCPRNALKNTLFLAAICCCFIALAKPVSESARVQVTNLPGSDIIIALETSKSMEKTDVKPDRLTRGKLGIIDFIDRRGADRVGLLLFSDTARLVIPLTSDRAVVTRAVQDSAADPYEQQGTDLFAAISTAAEGLYNQDRQRIIILVGDDSAVSRDTANRIARLATVQDIVINAVGIGAASAPHLEVNGRPFQTLHNLCTETGGRFFELGRQNQGFIALERLLEVQRIPRQHSLPSPVISDLSSWPLTLALLFFVSHLLITPDHPAPHTLHRGRISRRMKTVTAASTALITVMIAVVFVLPSRRYGLPPELNGSALFDRPIERLHRWISPAVVSYNEGVFAEQHGLFAQAVLHYDRALLSDKPQLQQQAAYNKANALYRLGEQWMNRAPRAAVTFWESAVDEYHRTLAVNPHNERAAENLAVVTTRLQRLYPPASTTERNSPNQHISDPRPLSTGRTRQLIHALFPDSDRLEFIRPNLSREASSQSVSPP